MTRSYITGMSIIGILYILLALDCAGAFHGDLSADVSALVALALAIAAVILELRNSGRFGAHPPA